MKSCLVILSVLLTGCAGVNFNTNVGPYVKNKAENSIRAGVVTEYAQNEIWHLNASALGFVNADYCQQDIRDEKPSQSYLMTKLKLDTQHLGGNGLVFDSCALQTTSAGCYSYMRCQGTAYKVTN